MENNIELNYILNNLDINNFFELSNIDKKILIKYKKNILEEILISEDYELIIKFSKLINFEDINTDMTMIICNNIDKDFINKSFFKWLFENNINLFRNIIEGTNKKIINILFKKIDCLDYIYNKCYLTQSDLSYVSILNNLTKFILDYQDEYLSKKKYYRDFNASMDKIEFYTNFDKIKFIMDFNEKNKNQIITNNTEYILECIIRFNSDIVILEKFIKLYNISTERILQLIKKNLSIFEQVCKNGSIQIINWYIEMIPDFSFITKTNYEIVFENACFSYNNEAAKIIYNLLNCLNYKISPIRLNLILNRLISDHRLSGDVDIIYDIINLKIKPTVGCFPKYKEYYENIYEKNISIQ